MQRQLFVGFLFFAEILAGQVVHLKTRNLETTGSQVEEARAPRHWRPGLNHRLLQFNTPISDDLRADLQLRGATITSTVPDNAVVVAVSDDFSTDGLDLISNSYMHADDKVSPLVGTHGNDSAFIVEFHADVDGDSARALLGSEGITIVEHPDLAANHVLVTADMDAVARLKTWDEVAYVFPAPLEMVNGDRFHTCVGALSSGMAVAQYVIVGHGWSRDASGQVNLGYFFSNLTSKVPEATVEGEVIRAMGEWSKVARVRFSEATSPTAAHTISVKFATGDHADGSPFDGPGGILAHTFYPNNPEPIAGDLHMDGAEGWHAGTNIDVYTVALHELGHALGLGHTDQPGAIMYPYYRFPAQIGLDDIAGVQQLYGAPVPSAAGSSSASSTDSTAPVFTTTIQTPAGGALPANTTAVNLTGIAANGSGAVAVTWQTDHGASGRATGGASWAATAVPVAVGSTTVTVTATDALHRTASKTVTFTRAVAAAQDTVPPVLNLTSPSSVTIQTTAAAIAVAGNATDNVGVTRVTWQASGSSSGTATGTTAWSVPAIPLLIGTNTVIIRAYDAAGNSSWRSLSVVRR